MSTSLKRIKMPSLTSSGFGSSLSEQFTNIDTNFKILSSLDLTKGETGDSSKFIAFNLNAVFACDENGYTTETGEETFSTYEYADYIDSSVFSDEIKIVTTKTLYDSWIEQVESNSDATNSCALAMIAGAEIKVTTTSLVLQVEQDIQTYCSITGNSRSEYVTRCKELLFSDLNSDSCVCGIINNTYSSGTDHVNYTTTETTYKTIYCAISIDVSGTTYRVYVESGGNYYYTGSDGQNITLYWTENSDDDYVLSNGSTEYDTTVVVSESEDDLSDYDNVLSVYVYDESNNVYVAGSESSDEDEISLYPNWISTWKTLVDSAEASTTAEDVASYSASAISIFQTHFACFNPGRIYMACELNQSETVVSATGVASEITYTASLPYLFIDPRFRSNYMSNIQVSGTDDYTDLVDVSSVLIGQTLLNSSNTSNSDDGTYFVFQCCQNSPNIYYNTATQQFCWMINGQKTDLPATGPSGADGEDISDFGDLYLYSGILATVANSGSVGSMYTTDASSSDDNSSGGDTNTIEVIIGDEDSTDSSDSLATISWSNYRYYYPSGIKQAESGKLNSITHATYPMSSTVYTAPIVLGNSIADALNGIGSQIVKIALAADEIYEILAELTSNFESLTTGWCSGLNIGSPIIPVYVSSGTITAFDGANSTVGGNDTPVWLNEGAITKLSAKVGSVVSPVYLNNGTITECDDVFVLKDCSMCTLSVSPTAISVDEISGKTLNITIITQDTETIAPGSSEAVNYGLVVKWVGVNAVGNTVLEEVESSEITVDDTDDEYGIGSCLYVNGIVKFNLYYDDRIIDAVNVEVPVYSLILDTNYVTYITSNVSYIPEYVNLVIQKTVGTGSAPGYIEAFEPGSTAATRENIASVCWSGYTYNGAAIYGEITSSSLYIGAEDSEVIDSNTTTLAGALAPGKSSAETTSGIVTITAASSISGLSIDPVYIYSTNSALDLYVSISNVSVLGDEIYSSGRAITSFEVYITNNVTGDIIYPGSTEAEEMGMTITWSPSTGGYTGTLATSTVNVTDTDDSGLLSLYEIWAAGDTVIFYLNFTSNDTTYVLDKYSLVPSGYYLSVNLTSISVDAEGNITFTWEESDGTNSTTTEIPDSETSDTYGKISIGVYDCAYEATDESLFDLNDNDLTITWTCGELTSTVESSGELYITYSLASMLILGYPLVFELYSNPNPDLIIDTITITPSVEVTYTYELEVDPTSTTISSTSTASTTSITVHVLKTSSTGTTSTLYASGYTDSSSGNYVTYNYTYANGTTSSECKFTGYSYSVSLKLNIVAVNFYLYVDDEQVDTATVNISYEVSYSMTADPLYVGLTYDDDGEVTLVADSLSVIITKTKLGTTTELTTYDEFISEFGDPDEVGAKGFILKASGYDISGNTRSASYTSETINIAETGSNEYTRPGHWLLYGGGSITFTATGTSTDSLESVTLTTTVNVCPYDLQVTGTPSFDIDAYGDIIVQARTITVYIRNVEDADDSSDSTSSSSATLIIPGSTSATNKGLAVTYDAYSGSTVTLNTYAVNITSTGATNNVYYNILNNGYVTFNLYYDGNLITSTTVSAAQYNVGVYPDTLYVTSDGFFDSSTCVNEVDSVLVSLIVYNSEGDDSEGYVYKDFSIINDNSGYLLWSGLTTNKTTLTEEIDVSSVPDSADGVVKLSIDDIDYSGSVSDCSAYDDWVRVICNENASSTITFTAYVNDNVIASDTLTIKNTITNSSSSDIRLKKNIELIGECVLDKLSNISLKSFDMIANGDHRYGVIAQELESEGLNELVKYDAAGYRSVDYTSLLILENELLKRKLAVLENSITEIKEIILPSNTGEN